MSNAALGLAQHALGSTLLAAGPDWSLLNALTATVTSGDVRSFLA